MNTLKTFSTKIIDLNGDKQTLTVTLTENDGIYGFTCSFTPEYYAKDLNVTDDLDIAEKIFDTLCKEGVLPLHFYIIIDELLCELNG